MDRIAREQAEDRFLGLLIGGAVGDALGLPAEGLSARRIKKRFKGRWHHRFVFGHGMVSDDTEHTLFVAQCLLAHPDSPAKFARALAWKLRWWLLCLPASIGSATLRSIVKLWLGASPETSGMNSAGNGAAMRSAVIGAFFADMPNLIDSYVIASTRVTHRDARALTGSMAVARLAGLIFRNAGTGSPPIDETFAVLSDVRPSDEEWQGILSKIRSSYDERNSVEEFAARLNLSDGVTGYVYHTVPVAIYAWMRYPADYENAVAGVLDCGGDTDTVAAITGALVGAGVGDKHIPDDWVRGIRDWPIRIRSIRQMGERLGNDGQSDIPAVTFWWPQLLLRNLFFFAVVVCHVLRRRLPPY